LIPVIHLSTSAFLEASSLHQSYHTIEELEGLETVMKMSFFAPPELYSIVMKLSSFVMSSRDVKLSY
jgi:hypothetical protein